MPESEYHLVTELTTMRPSFHPRPVGPEAAEHGVGHEAAGTCQIPNDQAEKY